MALIQSDILTHNNPNLAVVDSDFTIGGFRTAVATVGDLYALSGKTDEPSAAGQLKEYATIVYVSGETKYYVLVDIDNVDNASGWEEFVAGGAGTITGATNGLSLYNSGIIIGFGGTICIGIIILNLSYSIFLSGGTNSSVCSLIQSPYSIFPILEQTYVCQNADTIQLFAYRQSNGRLASMSLTGVNQSASTNTISMFASGAQIPYSDISLCGSNGIAVSGCSFDFHTYKIKICNANALTGGTTSDSLLVWDSDDFKVKSLAISAITSGITGTITGGTNGLGEIGEDVCLGGSLLNNTTINPNGYDLNLSGTTGEISLFIGDAVSYSNLLINDSISGITCGGNILLSSKCAFGIGGGEMFIEASSGASYVADYSSCNVNNPRWIPDKQYVDDADSIVNVRCFSDTCTTTVNDYYIGVVSPFSSTGGDFVCLIGSPGIGQKIIVTDMCGNALTDPIVIDAGGNFINGTTYTQSVINTNYGSITFIYNGVFWSATAFVN